MPTKGFSMFRTLKIPLLIACVWLTRDKMPGYGAEADPSSNEEFKPTIEAEMPQGFPGHTPVGTIEVKTYPAYRKASAAGATAFWKLFAHISSNDIAMTAPVEITYGQPDEQQRGESSMAFLYGRPDMGEAGPKGLVEVDDVQAMTVVSIGVRGAHTTAAVEEARRQLRTWLDERADEYRAAGPLRVMGYNSPMVPAERRFFEVQIPVEKVAASVKP